MNKVVNVQLLLFIQAIQIGIILGIVYDLVRILRKAVKHPNWIVQVEDGLYWATCLIISFGMLYNHNYVDIRIFVIMGMVMGAILYFATFSILFMRFATWVIDLVHRIIRTLIRLIMIPVNWCIRLLKIPLGYLNVQMNHLNQYSKKSVRKMRRRAYYVQADMKSGIKSKKHKIVYKTEKTD